jgi:hypothetical protein
MLGGNPAPSGKLNQWDLVNVAKSTATSAGVNLGAFSGVCVSGLGQVDLVGWIGAMTAICDTLSLSPSLLGHEMGHGYGLDHSRINGSGQDYQDPWDTMSVMIAFMAPPPNAEFGDVGPGLNAWNMRSRGRLDETRVWTSPSSDFDGVVQLRPLHRTDLPGFLAAEVQTVGPQSTYLVEFRVPQRWDAAIPRACVLVHSFSDNHSYLMYSNSGSRDIVAGDKFASVQDNLRELAYCAAEVLEIDEPTLTATLRLQQRQSYVRIPHPIDPVFGGVALPEGRTIMVGGKAVKVPTHGPALELVKEVARYLQIDISANNAATALAARREALEAVVRAAISLYADARPISKPPPGYPKDRGTHKVSKI